MKARALFTALLLFVLFMYCFSQLSFLARYRIDVPDGHGHTVSAPYKFVFFREYGPPALAMLALLWANLFVCVELIYRFVFRKNTGDKLINIEKQIRSGSLAKELGDRLSNQG